MPNDELFLIDLDAADMASLGDRNDIPGATVEEKLAWLVEDEIRRLSTPPADQVH